MEIKNSLPVVCSWAAVRWARKDAADLFKMGLMFISEDEHSAPLN